MKLESVRIQNFRSFKDETVKFDDRGFKFEVHNV